MKKLTALLLSAILILAACSAPAGESSQILSPGGSLEVDTLHPAESSALAYALCDFTGEVFKRSFLESTEKGENVMVSPLSVMLALAMTANGADTDTFTEMESVLTDEWLELEVLNRLLSAYTHNLPSTEMSKLNIANSIWFRDKGFTVNDDFLGINSEFYAAEIRKAPFNKTTLNEINSWVSEKTDNMIEKIIDEISDETMMFLINAIAFDAEWQTHYSTGQIKTRNFVTRDNAVMPTDFMHSNEYKYIETDNATGFLKPYKDNHYSFMALLPDENVTIDDFIANIDSNLFLNLDSLVSDEKVVTAMPKFKFDYTIVMNDLLKSMGMPKAFSGEADFSKLGKSDSGNIFISEVLHKTFIEVDERGTRAGAATSVDVTLTASLDEPKIVTLDRPFVFAIIDNDTNLPIFIGSLLEIPE